MKNVIDMIKKFETVNQEVEEKSMNNMNEQSQFKAFCENLNATCMGLQSGDKEIVSFEQANRALEYARHMTIEKAGDVLLFAASINLMNTYVKQKGCRNFGYSFKGYVTRLMDVLATKQIEGVVCNSEMDKRMTITIVMVNGIQFSYHCVQNAKQWMSGKTLPWDGVRKQKCAVTIFEAAEANQLLRTLDDAGKSEVLEKEEKKFQEIA